MCVLDVVYELALLNQFFFFEIGLTFVQYRGHAVISDVQNSSPVFGWVFPNDILIAIDEVPVSGMRVQDIVKVLTTRKDRQRALRVISSHTDFS